MLKCHELLTRKAGIPLTEIVHFSAVVRVGCPLNTIVDFSSQLEWFISIISYWRTALSMQASFFVAEVLQCLYVLQSSIITPFPLALNCRLLFLATTTYISQMLHHCHNIYFLIWRPHISTPLTFYLHECEWNWIFRQQRHSTFPY